MGKIKQETLELLIQELRRYKDDGVSDPWLLSDGTLVEPLDALQDLFDARETLGDIQGLVDMELNGNQEE
jgi:hypothetical protein